MLEVRILHEDDLPAVAALSAELGYPVTSAELQARCALLRRSTTDALLVAAKEHAVIGWAHVQERTLLESGTFAELVGLVVSATSRRTGAGRALVAASAAWAKARGLGRLRVRSNAARVESHHFYAALGFTRTKTSQVYDLVLS